jgi:AcrR family transcriptional regulator
MFAKNGYRAVSLRSIIRECGVNIAAIHYHFGSKGRLLEEIFARRCDSINSERRKLLKECETESKSPLILEKILDAFLRPSLIYPAKDPGMANFMRLRAVVEHEREDLVVRLIARHFNDTSQMFISRLSDCCRHLDKDEIFARFHFLLGIQYYVISNQSRIAELSGGAYRLHDWEEVLERMIRFVAAGFRAPAAHSKRLVSRVAETAFSDGAVV